MKETTEADWNRAVDEAADWRIRLADDPDDVDLARQFSDWRSASPLNAELWEKADRAYDLAGAMPRTLEVREALPDGTVAARRRVRGRRRWRIGAVAAIAACLLFLVGPTAMLQLQADHLTETAELRAIALEDGTKVQLGPSSAIGVDFSAGRRNVQLLKGEAFFDVVPDLGRPFRVTADNVVLTVLGTSFEVQIGGGSVSVAVREGRVRIDGDGLAAAEALLTGDWVSVRGSAVERGTRDPKEIGDWLGGELVARDRPVMEVVDAVRRSFGGMIVVQDNDFARLRVTGVYDLRRPEATLANLAFSHEARIRHFSPWLVVITSK